MNPKPILELDPDKVRVLISRERDAAGFKAMAGAMEEFGQVLPGQVRDLRHLAPRERQRPGGGTYDYELITGQGRLERARKAGAKFRATVEDKTELKTLGMFMSENLNRDPLPSFELGKLLKGEVDAGATVKQAAKQMHISESYADRLLAIVNKTAQGLEADVADMSVADAEAFTQLPTTHQGIVMGVLKETDARQVKTLVRKAKEAATKGGGELSESALRQSLKRTGDELAEQRAALKLADLHYSIGPQNLALLLEDKAFAAALKAAGVITKKFEAIYHRAP